MHTYIHTYIYTCMHSCMNTSRNRQHLARFALRHGMTIVPAFSASIRAASSTIAPRAVLINRAVGFMSLSLSALSRCHVESFSGQWMDTKSLRRNCAPPHWGEWLAQRVGSGMGCGGYVQGNSTCLMISHTSQAGGHSGVCGVLCLIFFVRYWKPGY